MVSAIDSKIMTIKADQPRRAIIIQKKLRPIMQAKAYAPFSMTTSIRCLNFETSCSYTDLLLKAATSLLL